MKVLRATAAIAAALHLPASLRADAGEPGKPKWQMLFPKGTFHNGGWPEEGVTIDDAFCRTMVANWEKRGKPELSVDYFHLGNDEDAEIDERIAAGGIQSIEARDDGLWGLIDFTERARARILAKELKFLSPEWSQNGIDAHTGLPQGPTLICAGLLNNPAFKEMPRVAAAAVPLAPPKEMTMNKAAIIALLAKAGTVLDPSITDEAAQAALAKHFDQVAADRIAAAAKEEAILKAKAASEDGLTALRAQLATKDAETAKLQKDVAALTASSAKLEADRKAEGIVALQKRLISEHRIVAAAQDSVKEFAEKQGLEAAVKFYDTFPKGAIAPGSELGVGAGAGTGDGNPIQKLRAAAAELEKGGMKPSEAFRAASRAHPEVAALAFPTATARSATRS